LLIGEYSYSVDVKGRLFIPAKMREKTGDNLVIAKSFDNCLNVYSEEKWAEFAAKIQALPEMESRAVKRFIFSSAQELPVDSQGRVCIPLSLRKYAHLDEDNSAMIVGVDDRIEIWSSGEYEKMQSEIDREELVSFLVKSGF